MAMAGTGARGQWRDGQTNRRARRGGVLVRDYLRTTLRSMRPSAFTPDRVEMMAANLADRPNLLKIRNHQALEEYIRLYMVKMLKR